MNRMEQTVSKCRLKEIKIPKKWNMITPMGNQSMQRRAESLIKNLTKVMKKGGSFSESVKCFEKYFNSYESACQTKSISEAGTTDVRVSVLSFAHMVGKEVNIDEKTLDSVWEQRKAKQNK